MLLLLLVISTDSSRAAAAAAAAVAAGQLVVACTARNNAGIRAAFVAVAVAAVATVAAAAAAASSYCGRLGCGLSGNSLLLLLRLLRVQPGRLARHWLWQHHHAGMAVLEARQRAGARAVDHLQVEQAGAGRAPWQHRNNQALVSHVGCAAVAGHWEAACCVEAGGVQAAAQPGVAERDIDTCDTRDSRGVTLVYSRGIRHH
jgi:hypothetical protein